MSVSCITINTQNNYAKHCFQIVSCSSSSRLSIITVCRQDIWKNDTTLTKEIHTCVICINFLDCLINFKQPKCAWLTNGTFNDCFCVITKPWNENLVFRVLTSFFATCCLTWQFLISCLYSGKLMQVNFCVSVVSYIS